MRAHAGFGRPLGIDTDADLGHALDTMAQLIYMHGATA